MFGLSTNTGIVPAFLMETFSQHPQNTSTYVWDDALKYCSTAAGVARITVPPRISPSLAIPSATSPTVSPVGTATFPENVIRYLPGFTSVICALPALCLSAHPPFVATAENGIQNLSGQLCNGLAGVNANLSNLGYQMQQCCCDTREAIAGVNYNMAAQTNILQNTVNNGFRDVIDAQNAGTQRIIDLFTQDKIQSLQTELQSAQLQLSNNAQTNSILNALRPTPVPSYPVMSPYTSIVNPTGFSFGAGCGYGGNTGCGC